MIFNHNKYNPIYFDDNISHYYKIIVLNLMTVLLYFLIKETHAVKSSVIKILTNEVYLLKTSKYCDRKENLMRQIHKSTAYLNFKTRRILS